MTMHKALYLRDDVEGQYVSRKDGGKGFTITEDSADASIQRLEDYIKKRKGEQVTDITNDTDNTMDNRITITRKQTWQEKQLYGRFKRLINNTRTRKLGRG